MPLVNANVLTGGPSDFTHYDDYYIDRNVYINLHEI